MVLLKEAYQSASGFSDKIVVPATRLSSKTDTLCMANLTFISKSKPCKVQHHHKLVYAVRYKNDFNLENKTNY